MKGIRGGKIYHNGRFEEGLVLLYDTEIQAVIKENELNSSAEVEWTDADGKYVTPGFIDVHIHGYKGHDTMDCDAEGIKAIAKGIAENGVTSFLPTTMTMPMAKIEEALNTVRDVKDSDYEGAEILGVHMEGPFINENYKGAQPKDAIIVPNHGLVERHKDIIKVITIAPDVDGALDLISTFRDDINFSMGHTGASYEQASEAIDHGACCTTHLFNAMTGIHHRKPGVVGAAFNKDIYSEMIADKIHVHPELFQMVAKNVGLDKLLLITDCMQGGGLDEGYYELGGQKVLVKDGKCTLESGTIAGSVLTLDRGLRNFNEHVSHTLEEILPVVTENQARYLGIEDETGTLETGKRANIVIMDEGLNICTTIVKGSKIYEI